MAQHASSSLPRPPFVHAPRGPLVGAVVSIVVFRATRNAARLGLSRGSPVCERSRSLRSPAHGSMHLWQEVLSAIHPGS